MKKAILILLILISWSAAAADYQGVTESNETYEVTKENGKPSYLIHRKTGKDYYWIENEIGGFWMPYTIDEEWVKSPITDAEALFLSRLKF